ncbi:MAG: hypothetical protein GY929_12460 [Actinomycetia bacterium]|nr:hypothetical protein [Actinomycetes bacterium]
MPIQHLEAERRREALPHGRTVVVREVRPDDRAALRELYRGLDPEDRYKRFFTHREPRPSFFERLINAPSTGGGCLVVEIIEPDGSARIVAEADHQPGTMNSNELGIVVGREWRGWLGHYLFDALLEDAAARGLDDLEAYVLATNRPMLSLTRSHHHVLVGDNDWSVLRVIVGTHSDTPVWPDTGEQPRVLVEVPGGHWHAAAEAEKAGLRVLACPGPGARSDTCPALDGHSCPLAAEADVVVVSPRQDDTEWAQLLDAHARCHPRVPVVIDGRSRAAVEGRVKLPANDHEAILALMATIDAQPGGGDDDR